MAVYGYIRVIEDAPGELCKAESVQKGAIIFFGLMHGNQPDDFFVEHSYGTEVPLFQRFEGRRMLKMLKPGDVVIATAVDRVFGTSEDAKTSLQQFRSQKIDLQLIDFGGSVINSELSGMITQLLQAA
jgi:putative DNA-invertase from lambdoid prophage Rac